MRFKSIRVFRKQIMVVVLIFLLAFVLRFIYLRQIADAPYVEYPAGDSRVFFNRAVSILEGDIVGNGIPFYSSPLYPYLIALIFLAFGRQVLFLYAVQVLIGSFNCVVIYLLTRRVTDGTITPAVVSGVCAALYGVLVFFDSEMLMICLTLVFVTLGLLLLIEFRRTQKTYQALVCGILFGLAALDRSNILLFIPFAAWYIAGEFTFRIQTWKWKPVILFITGVIMIIAPMTLRNVLTGRDFVLISSNAGVNLYIGNNYDAKGVFHIPPESGLSANDLSGTSIEIAQRETGQTLSPSRVSWFWAHKALQFMYTQPLKALVIMGQKVLRFWNAYEVPNNLDFYYVRSNIAPVLHLAFVGFWLIAPIAVAGIIWRCLRTLSAPDKLLVVFLVTYMVSVLPFFITERYRMPIIPVLIVYAAITVIDAVRCLRRRNIMPVVFLTMGVLALGVFMNWPMVRFNYSRMRTIMGTRYLERAMTEPQEYSGDIRKAIFELKWAAELIPYDIYVRYQLGRAYATFGYYTGAMKELQRILSIDPDKASALNALTMTRRQFELTGDRVSLDDIPITPFEQALSLEYLQYQDRAVETYQTVIKKDPYHFQSYHQCSMLLQKTGESEKAIRLLQKGMKFLPDNVILMYDLGMIYFAYGDKKSARKMWERCLQIEPGNKQIESVLRLLEQ